MQRLTRAQSRLLNAENYPTADKQALGAQNPSRQDTSISKIPRLKKRQREIPVNLADLDGAPELKRAKKDLSTEAPQFKPVVGSEKEQCTLANRLHIKTVIENHDIESLRGFLRSAQSTIGRRVFLLHEAVRHAWLHGIDTLVEFGTLKEALKMDMVLTQKGLPTLFQKAASGENSLILDHLNELARPLRQRRREDLKLALLNAVFKSDLPTLQQCCAIADMEKVKWSSAEMSQFICEAVSNTEPRSSNVVPGAAVIAYLSNTYPDRIAPSTYNAALIGAVKTNNWQAASMLLSVYRADPNAKDGFGRTALMHAAENGEFDIYELLRFHDASPHAQNKDGTSVLHHAVDGGNSRIVADLVMNAKVDISATNTANQTASTRAGFLAKDNIAELIKYGIYGPFDRTDF